MWHRLADTRPDLAKLDPVLAVGLAKHPQYWYPRCHDFARGLSEQIDSSGVPPHAALTSRAPVGAAPSNAKSLSVQNDSGERRGGKPRPLANAMLNKVKI